MRCVTSFSADGYSLYGKRMLETYCEHNDVPISVYIETPEEPDFQHELVTYKDLFKCEGINDFLARCTFPVMEGNLWAEGKINYRYNIYRFCRKSFAQINEASQHGDWLYWIDADVEFSGPFEFPWKNNQDLSNPYFMYYLDRPEWHSCASFVGWNLNHEMSGEFWKRYWLIYTTGTVFALPEWHDSYILDWLREQMKFPCVDLAAGLDLKGPANVFDEVFKNAHHKKGNLKHVA